MRSCLESFREVAVFELMIFQLLYCILLGIENHQNVRGRGHHFKYHNLFCKNLIFLTVNYVMLDTPNDMASELKYTAKRLMVGRKNNQTATKNY